MATLGTLAVERSIDGLTLAALLLVFVAFVDSSARLREILLAGASYLVWWRWGSPWPTGQPAVSDWRIT